MLSCGMASSTLKAVTVRLPEEDLELARQEAGVLGISVGVYLRLVLRQSLRYKVDPVAMRERRADALRRFSEVMAAEAEGRGYTEDDVLRSSKEARKRLAAERQVD